MAADFSTVGQYQRNDSVHCCLQSQRPSQSVFSSFWRFQKPRNHVHERDHHNFPLRLTFYREEERMTKAKTDDVIFIDIREEYEFKAGHNDISFRAMDIIFASLSFEGK